MEEKVDVAINIFAKPWQTSLAILSILRMSGEHINKIWLQFEPMGSRFDTLSSYAIIKYLTQNDIKHEVSQPDKWLAREPVTDEMLKTWKGRAGIRYETAFENSNSRLLFLMHNDIWVFKDIIGALKKNIGDAFIIGELGQCWNCPAANPDIACEVMNQEKCTPLTYMEFRPTHAQLCQLYESARKKNVFIRPYDTDNFEGEFKEQPWPLPECRVNEWACLLNLELARPLTAPHATVYPPGAFRKCGDFNLDIITPFFRGMHAQGLTAKHFDIKKYIKHWVGTGNKSPGKYAFSEDRAKGLIQKHFPEYIEWLKNEGEKI